MSEKIPYVRGVSYGSLAVPQDFKAFHCYVFGVRDSALVALVL